MHAISAMKRFQTEAAAADGLGIPLATFRWHGAARLGKARQGMA